MDEEIERLIVSVRADTTTFRRDVAEMRGELAGPFSDSADRAGRLLENALSRAVRTGRLGFDDLKRMALSAMAEIAAAAVSNGIGTVVGGLPQIGSLLGAILGLPGRATGGPVAPGRAYRVGERGPELFVPASSGRIDPQSASVARDVRVSITVNAPSATAPRALEQSSRQVARAVKQALMRID